MVAGPPTDRPPSCYGLLSPRRTAVVALLVGMGTIAALAYPLGVVLTAWIGTGHHRRRFGPSSLSTVEDKAVVVPRRPDDDGSWLEAHFPQCVRPRRTSGRKGRNETTGAAEYVPSEHPPRYDHLSCYVMKSRYNCARPPADTAAAPTRPEASGYKLVWQPPPAPSGGDDSGGSDDARSLPCDFRAVIDAIGGPAGVARDVVRRRRRRRGGPPAGNGDGDNQSSNDDNGVLQVLLLGNSYVRQVFEALVCGFDGQITDVRVQLGGPDSSIAALRESGQLGGTELGDFWEGGVDGLRAGGCHSPSGGNQSAFFPPDVAAPPTIDGCNNDVGMVEFGGSIRFYYIFRPYRYDEGGFEEIRRGLGMVGNEMDVIASNSARREQPNFNVTGRRTIKLERLLPYLKQLQRKDLGSFFGADNPWITRPPDGHPCMPGVPDDEANVLLFLLLAEGSILEQLF